MSLEKRFIAGSMLKSKQLVEQSSRVEQNFLEATIMNHSIQKVFEKVRSENLLLRMPKPEDLRDVFSIESDPATNKYRPAGSMKDLNEAKETLERWRNDWFTYGYGYWSVVLPSHAEVIGIGGIARDRWKEQDVLNLYYRFSPNAWGHGYATELARIAVNMADEHLPDLPVIARIRFVNTPSRRVAERIGLRHCPELDSAEHMVFASRNTV
jgi:RimJ/RimL family protein N-acetyltransferase